MVHSFRVTSGLVNPQKWCSPRLRLCEHHYSQVDNPDANLKGMHQLYIVDET